MSTLHEDRCYCVPVRSAYGRSEIKKAQKPEISVVWSGNTNVLQQASHSLHPPSLSLCCAGEERTVVLAWALCWDMNVENILDKVSKMKQVKGRRITPQAPILEIWHLSEVGGSIWLVFKAALINIFILTMDQKTVQLERGAHELTENYHTTLQFPSALWSVLLSLSSLFWFYGPQLYCSDSVSPLSSTSFPAVAGSCFHWKSSLYTTLPSTQ